MINNSAQVTVLSREGKLTQSHPSGTSNRPVSEPALRAVELVPVSPNDELPLAGLFESNDVAEVTAFFDPFPLNAASARAVALHVGRDMYWKIVCREELVGLCMVRGWDAGAEHRAIGTVISRTWQSAGIGEQATVLALEKLRAAGEKSVRARIHKTNSRSRAIAIKVGFVEIEVQGQQIVYECDLSATR